MGTSYTVTLVLRTGDLPLTQFRLQLMCTATGSVSAAQKPLAPASLGREHPQIPAGNLGGDEKSAFIYASTARVINITVK